MTTTVTEQALHPTQRATYVSMCAKRRTLCDARVLVVACRVVDFDLESRGPHLERLWRQCTTRDVNTSNGTAMLCLHETRCALCMDVTMAGA